MSFNAPSTLTLEFQFHKGTIRTALGANVFCVPVEFQFHKGTIRTSYAADSHPSVPVFQFHKGTIRTPTTYRPHYHGALISIP